MYIGAVDLHRGGGRWIYIGAVDLHRGGGAVDLHNLFAVTVIFFINLPKNNKIFSYQRFTTQWQCRKHGISL